MLDDDPEVAALRASLRQSRRKQALGLMALGIVLIAAGVIMVWQLGRAREATSGDAASGTMVSIVFAAAGLAGLIGLALVGTAIFVLIRTRSGVTEQDH